MTSGDSAAGLPTWSLDTMGVGNVSSSVDWGPNSGGLMTKCASSALGFGVADGLLVLFGAAISGMAIAASRARVGAFFMARGDSTD